MVSSGFIIAKRGRMRFVRHERLCRPLIFVITDEALASLPAAGIVSTTPTGRAADGVPFPQKKSQKSPSYTAPSAIALAVSITEPPPTARMKLTPSLRAMPIPSYTLSSVGFGCTPFSMQYEILLLSRESVTCFTSPLFSADCPP